MDDVSVERGPLAVTLDRKRSALWLSIAGLTYASFLLLAATHGGFVIAQGRGVQRLDDSELVFALYYVTLGSVALFALGRGLIGTRLVARVMRTVDHALRTPDRLAQACALVCFAGSFAFRRFILAGQPIADDESAYDFIADTLRMGRVWNPTPFAPELLRNQYVIATEQAWYGKYPIGHPLVLALGDALHVGDAVLPAIGGASVLATYAIGRRVTTPRLAAIGCGLLALSPHFVLTHGTRLSQPTSALCMLLGVLALLELLETRALRWAALSGAAFGFGVLARPFPGVLFVLAALVAYVVERPKGALRARFGRSALELALAGLGVGAAAVLLAWVNHAQSGDPWISGYQTIHSARPAPEEPFSELVMLSVSGALLRENLWLHGWPLSLLLVPLARFGRGRWAVWGMIAAALAYRVILPKTVVATTGPVYTLEVVPLLCLATAAGAARATELLARRRGQALAAGGVVAAHLVAATVVAALMFAPPQIATVERGVKARAAASDLMLFAKVSHAVVFANVLVSPFSGDSWAYFPPNPSPALDDDIVMLRLQLGIDGYHQMLAVWRSRFPDRSAYMLLLTHRGFALLPLPLKPGVKLPRAIEWAEPQ